MNMIRKSEKKDISRIAEILIFAKRTAYRPIFRDDAVSFGVMQVLPLCMEYLDDPHKLDDVWVYDDGFVKGLIRISGAYVSELYVDPFFQKCGVGSTLLTYATVQRGASRLWVLEKNETAKRMYAGFGFVPSGERKLESGTTEYLVEMVREPERDLGKKEAEDEE